MENFEEANSKANWFSKVKDLLSDLFSHGDWDLILQYKGRFEESILYEDTLERALEDHVGTIRGIKVIYMN